MRLNVFALGLACGLLSAVAILLVAGANVVWPNYGQAFLELASSIYPGYHAAASIRDILIGASYAFVDGTVAGLAFGIIYNFFAEL